MTNKEVYKELAARSLKDMMQEYMDRGDQTERFCADQQYYASLMKQIFEMQFENA